MAIKVRLTAYKGIDDETGEAMHMLAAVSDEYPTLMDCVVHDNHAITIACYADRLGMIRAISDGIVCLARATEAARAFIDAPTTQVLWSADLLAQGLRQ